MTGDIEPSPHEVTQILEAISGGDKTAEEELIPLVYSRLKRLAGARMAREKTGHTLQTTALVHETYLRLLGDENPRWENRAHFFAAAAEAMRRILIERARRHARIKHGGGLDRVTLDEDAVAGIEPRAEELLALDEALTRLEARDPEMGKVVALRYFAGLTLEETANALGISPSRVSRLWRRARAWLQQEMTRLPDAPDGSSAASGGPIAGR